MKIELTEQELINLKKTQRKAGLHRRRYIKVTVIIMLYQGFDVSQIEAALGIDDNTIYRYEKAYKKVGLKSYVEDGFVPYTGKLNEVQLDQLDLHLQQFCYPDAHSICHYIKETFDVEFTSTGLLPLLHRLGFEYKLTKIVPGKANESDQITFLEETLPQLLDQVQQGNAVLYYSDGVHPTHNTKRSRGWIKKGFDFEIKANSGRKRVNVNAAVNAHKPSHLVYDIADSINAQSTKRVCQKLLRKHPKKTIYLICDNARYNRNKELQLWAINQRIEFVFLPTYSPNLNLIERLWRFLNKKILNSQYFEKYEDFKNAIRGFLENLKPYKNELESLLTLNFRTVEGTSIYSQTN